ncbi:hypothetical protein ABC382_00600 [Lysinibacillus sp. 1P01SD]|uniref:hypothetical protein n=1 Tax=Lysinibacillus sp. 1P01SD TaxID=3132285 RepID=UPI0039A29FF7
MNLFKKKETVLANELLDGDEVLNEELIIQPPPLPLNMDLVLREIKTKESVTSTIQFSEKVLDAYRESPTPITLDMPLELTASNAVELDYENKDNRIYTTLVTIKSLALYTALSFSLTTTH